MYCSKSSKKFNVQCLTLTASSKNSKYQILINLLYDGKVESENTHLEIMEKLLA